MGSRRLPDVVKRWAVNVAAALFVAECVLGVVAILLLGWSTIPLWYWDRKFKAEGGVRPDGLPPPTSPWLPTNVTPSATGGAVSSQPCG